MSIIASRNRSLPRDLDVQVNVSKPQVETTTDLSTGVCVVKDAPFDHGANRIRFYSSLAGVEADFAAGTPARDMASAFFAQSPRAQTMAVGRAFENPVAGFMVSGSVGELTAFQAVNDGSFSVTIDGDTQDITGLDLTGVADLAAVATTIQTAVQAINTGGFVAATVTIVNNILRITSGTTGDNSNVSFLSAAATGTDISGSTLLNAEQGVAVSTDGYAPTGIANELALILEASRQSGRFVYGWCLERSYRDTSDQLDAARWALSQTAFMPLTSNSVAALNAQSTTDLGAVLNTEAIERAVAFWSESPREYPDVALMAYALHVDYAAENSTITLKFKDLNGITPSGITEAQLTVLQSKNYNVLTRIGNITRTLREGETSDNQFWIDELLGLDNFREEVQVEVYNVFLRERKVPFTTDGAGLIQQAIRLVCERYVFNGFLAPRPVSDQTRVSGERVDPPYDITYTPLRLISTADRQARIGPPFTVNLRLAGAIHEVSVNVQAFV